MSFIKIKNKTTFLSLYLLVGLSFWWLSFQLWNYKFSLFLLLAPQYYLGGTEADLMGWINFNSIFCNLSLGPLRFGPENNFKQGSPLNPFWHTNFYRCWLHNCFLWPIFFFSESLPFPLAIYLLDYLQMLFHYQLYTWVSCWNLRGWVGICLFKTDE